MTATGRVTRTRIVQDMSIKPAAQCQESPLILDCVCCGSYLAWCRTWLPRESRTPDTHSPQCPSSSAREIRRNNSDHVPRPSVVHGLCLFTHRHTTSTSTSTSTMVPPLLLWMHQVCPNFNLFSTWQILCNSSNLCSVSNQVEAWFLGVCRYEGCSN